MRHLLINRDYPPCSYAHGGIGTYASRLSSLLAARGETVHVITQMWPGAPHSHETSMSGRLIVHRVPLDEPLDGTVESAAVLESLLHSRLSSQAFAWQAALLCEALINRDEIDIIEGQEYEAPLSFVMLRRALGATPRRHVPIVVHLHSGTEFAFTYNGYQNRPDFLPASRFEEYTIRSADALLCPSRFLVDAAARRYGLDPDSIEIIPYPIGLGPVLHRDAHTWTSGDICYVGRLEPRKGVSEWVDAAVAVAPHHPGATFTLIGGDSPFEGGHRSTRSVLQGQIPGDLSSRFRFIGFVPPEQLAKHLASSRFAVVPSRFDNFPYSCIEAMASGLPVLATPGGGMIEMVEDGRSGWIAGGCDSRSLEAALNRALTTSPARLAEMGNLAASRIRALCDNDRTLERQLAFRRDVIAREDRRAARSGVTAYPNDVLSRLASAIAARQWNGLPYPLPLAQADSCDGDAVPAMPAVRIGGTLRPRDVLRVTREEQINLLRRACTNPGYTVRWLTWHARRSLRQLGRGH